MKILLLGKNGLLGSEMAAVLANYNLVVWDKENLDVTSEEQVMKKISALKPKWIINCTGYTDVDGAERWQKQAYLLNETACLYLAKAANKVGARLIHFSSDYVFDGEKSSGYTEDDSKNPLSVYGASKSAGEDVIRQTAKKYFIIRTSWLYGKNGKNFVDKMLELARDRDEITVVSDQMGSPTYAADLAKAIPQFFELNNYGIYHLTNSGAVTWFDFAKLIFLLKKVAVTVTPIASEELNRPAKRPKYSLLNNTKLPPLRDWKEGLKEYLEVSLDSN